MSRSDPLLMLADIVEVASERPELDRGMVQAIYQNYILTQGRQPTIEQARDYIDRLTSRLDEATLRQRLGLVAPRKRGPRAPGPPKRGRPKGSGQLTIEAVRTSHTALRREHNRRPTQQQLASRLDVAVRTLQDFLQANDMRWPLEE